MRQSTGNSDPRVVATINQAIALESNGQLLAAVQLLTTLARECSDASSVHGYLAWYLSQSGRHEEAAMHSSEAVGLSPASERASLVHFHALWSSGQHLEAIAEMNRFLTIRPSSEYNSIFEEWDSARYGPGGTP
jgi:hypothetical protein